MPSSSGDSRKDFFLTTTANYFGLRPNDDAITASYSSKELNTFLDDGNSSTLAVLCHSVQRDSVLKFTNKLESESDIQDGSLVFLKVKPDVVTPDNMHNNILVSSMFESPATTLYHTLHNMFAPLLLKSDSVGKTVDPKLQSLLTELEAGLGSWLRKDEVKLSRKGDGTLDEKNVSSILTPSDEFQFWADVAVTERDNSERNRASYFVEIFQRG